MTETEKKNATTKQNKQKNVQGFSFNLFFPLRHGAW